ncbi:Small-conductance mechanosensitive channel [Ohtaekwangia koreensis]|uniref:Small-conductance mechanosensitive channel n=2 Tax=Ohtaekwangia koreensis TaxID=688867 RepID=A0A1T5KBY3_9BACT|nr:Small-conductance mechanosensitive channel [Ohtaekwangia koreensis]
MYFAPYLTAGGLLAAMKIGMNRLKHYTLVTIALVVVSVFTTSLTFAQRSKWRKDRNQSLTLFSDSATATAAEYMLHLEMAYQKIDSVQNVSKLSPEIMLIGLRLTESDSIIHFVDQSLIKYEQTLNLRNLEILKILLENAQQDLHKYNESFKASDARLSKLRLEITGLRKDSVLRKLFRDSVSRKKFIPQLKGLRSRRRYTDSLLTNSLTTLHKFKTQASAGSILSAQLMNQLNTRLSMAGKKVFEKELNYLWEKPVPSTSRESLAAVFKEEQKALTFYYSNSSENRFVRWLVGIAFLWWVMRNLRILKRKDKLDSVKPYGITYLVEHPILSALAVVFSMAPLFDLHAPAAYTQFVQFLLIITLTSLYRKQWSRRLFYYWLGIAALFIVFSFTNHILIPSLLQRLFIIILNVVAVALALLFRKALPRDHQLARFIRVVLILLIVMNVLAIFANISGRLTLANMLSMTSVFGLTQVIGLSAMVKILVEAVLLQIHTSRLQQSLVNVFDPAPIVQNFRRPLLGIVLLIWIVVFSANLNIYDTLFKGVSDILNAQQHIGNTSFTVGSILLFFLIIWVAHFLQRYIGYFLGDIGDDEGEGLAHRSRLLMTKLVLLGAGYLLAVSASGLPVDKITIVLGALGVGIGLGLQNIVNNFVSGIILIFDRPLKVGDSVEVGSHAGRVKEIGLRSSTLVTTDGADVIIPNGDVLSQHIVNWTLGNTYKRLDFNITITLPEKNEDDVIQQIKEVIKNTDCVLKKREPAVLVESVKDNDFLLKVFFWCEDVYKEEQTKSEVRYQIYRSLKDQGINSK